MRRGLRDVTFRTKGGGVRVAWEVGGRVTREELHAGL